MQRLIRTDADIKATVKAWCGEWDLYDGCVVPGDPVRAEAEYGHISQWDTEQVTSMKELFWSMSKFNEDISRWDVRNVREMRYMFNGASSFNQDLSGWDVRNVESMAAMFRNASSFNQDLNRWDVGNVSNMQSMFDRARCQLWLPRWYRHF